MSIFRGLQFKIQLPVFIMAILLVGTTLTISTVMFSRFVHKSADDSIRRTAKAVKHEMTVFQDYALEQIQSLAARKDIVEAVNAKDRDAIFQVFDRFQSRNKCQFFTVVDEEGKVLARTNNRAKFGDSQLHLKTVKDVLDGKGGCVYFERTSFAPVSIRAAAPIFGDQGQILGVMSGGFRLDSDTWVDHIKEMLDVDCTVFNGEERAATTLLKDGKRAAGTPLNNPVVKAAVFDRREDFIPEQPVMVLGNPMKVFYSPILGPDGKTFGIMFAGIPTSEATQAVSDNVYTNILIAIVGQIVFNGVLMYLVGRIVGPVKRMTKNAEDLAKGNFDFRLDVNTGDEIEVLAREISTVATSLREKTDVALSIAKGDLTTWVPLSSDKDGLGKALIEMRYGLYDSIKDLSSLATTVAAEGQSLSQTNQNLLENTTRSAEQLHEVAGSIDQLNTQTAQNADNAKQADSAASLARKASGEGKEKMERMVHSMDEITKSAGEIKKIIRVIDDIAFQTNLLALNAAVEAARAGQHGKGFAVVAEEVRNLASRSAKAAQETASLIEESIRQVGIGSEVAEDTSTSLNDITEQTERVSGIISRISHDSLQQTESLDKANVAIGQVSEASSRNTDSVSEALHAATSISKSAAALDSITRHFKYNEGGKVSPSLTKDAGYIPNPGELKSE